VIDGMDIVQEISRAKRDGNDKPKDDIVMETVEISD